MKKILVTGGTGFIGSNIVKYLVKKKENVLVFDNNSRGSVENLSDISDSFKYLNGDIRDREKLIEFSKNVDTIIHLAYVNGTKSFYSIPYEILEIAIKGISNVIDAMNINDIPNLILASSSEVYQEPKIIPTDEKIPLIIPDVFNPRLSYGGGKIISELLSINFARTKERNLKVFRPHNVYGPNMGNEHVIPEFINKILFQIDNKEINLEIQGNGKETRSFIYIDDFISGFDSIYKKGSNLNIYNIGTDDEISINNLINLIEKIIEKKINIINKDKTFGSSNRRCPDISKIKSLGFNNIINLEEGLKRTFEWYKKKYEK